MTEKIVITGMGIVTGLGAGKDATLDALRNGKSAIGRVLYLQTDHKEIPVSEVKMSDEEMKKMMNISSDKIITRNPLLGMVAIKEAIQESGLTDSDSRRFAFINGTTVGGMEKSEEFYLDFFDNKHTEYIAVHDCGAGTEEISTVFGHFDYMTTISTACSSASNSIIQGANMIKAGRVDAAIVGGTESLSKFHLNGFNTLMILDKENCKPFDKDRVGLNLGEGAAYLVLEKESDAKKRGAKILCELKGYANTCDAFHQTATSPNGEGAYLAMKKALEDSKLQPSDIDYINAHGTGTSNNDLCESIAIKRAFPENTPIFSSTKAFTGHTTSAAGSVEAVISILSLQNNFIPKSLNFKNQMDDVEVAPTKENITDRTITNVMTNSFGFGGNDSSCIFSKIE